MSAVTRRDAGKAGAGAAAAPEAAAAAAGEGEGAGGEKGDPRYLWDVERLDPSASRLHVALLALWWPFGTVLAVVRIALFLLGAVPAFALLRALLPGTERYLLQVVHPLLGIHNRYVWKDTSSVYYEQLVGGGVAAKLAAGGTAAATPIVVANHRSDYDFTPFQFRPFGVLVSPYWKRMDNWCRACGLDFGLIYARDTAAGDSASRSDRVRAAIHDHLRASHGTLPLLAFPEGGTTNGKGVLQFNKFLFSLGVPIQPCAIRLSAPITKWRTDVLFDSFLSNTFAMTFNPLTVYETTFLPPMEMNDEDRAAEDPAAAFAGRVQKAIADELGVPATNHTFRDKNRLRSNWNPW